MWWNLGDVTNWMMLCMIPFGRCGSRMDMCSQATTTIYPDTVWVSFYFSVSYNKLLGQAKKLLCYLGGPPSLAKCNLCLAPGLHTKGFCSNLRHIISCLDIFKLLIAHHPLVSLTMQKFSLSLFRPSTRRLWFFFIHLQEGYETFFIHLQECVHPFIRRLWNLWREITIETAFVVNKIGLSMGRKPSLLTSYSLNQHVAPWILSTSGWTYDMYSIQTYPPTYLHTYLFIKRNK